MGSNNDLAKAIGDLFAPLYKSAREAHKRGDFRKERELRHDIALVKMQIRETARATHPALGRTRFGPGVVQLFENTGTLRDDPRIKGI